ncbi:phage tail protein [Pantoea sp. V108_6]|nr:phage tail protein [Pantoea sp. V108_6]MDI3363677.1 phage tail protein [Pantoea sp. V108_6]
MIKSLEHPKNLGLGEGAPLIGSPFAWPHSKMPNELFASMAGMVFVKANGASFSSTTYPKLAVLYPGLKLPDLRGEFIRGWDDGRGVDSSRNLLSSQEDMFKSHNHRFVNEYGTPTDRIIAYTDENNENAEANNVSGVRAWTYIFMEKTGGNETRPRNIAFNYILRAA